MGLLVISITFLVITVSCIVLYNRLVRKRNMVKEGWSGIEVQLKRRSDLIPNLVNTVKAYAGHEKSVLTEITDLRARSLGSHGISEKGHIEGALSHSLTTLFAVVESYPDLKAQKNFLSLQKELSEIEDQIQMARRYYNGCVRDLNIAIESFPGNIIAHISGFRLAEFFQIDNEADRKTVAVTF